MSTDRMRCQTLVDTDGAVLGVARVAPNISAEARAALLVLCRVVRDQMPPLTPEEEARQAASLARIRERNQRLGITR